MSEERLVFPIKIEGYGEIKGMSGWQDFILHYKQKVRAFNRLRKYVAGIEAMLGAPDDLETEWDAFEAIKKLKGECINKQSDTVRKPISATIAAEEDSFEATQALNENAVDDAIASNEWVE